MLANEHGRKHVKLAMLSRGARAPGPCRQHLWSEVGKVDGVRWGGSRAFPEVGDAIDVGRRARQAARGARILALRHHRACSPGPQRITVTSVNRVRARS